MFPPGRSRGRGQELLPFASPRPRLPVLLCGLRHGVLPFRRIIPDLPGARRRGVEERGAILRSLDAREGRAAGLGAAADARHGGAAWAAFAVGAGLVRAGIPLC